MTRIELVTASVLLRQRSAGATLTKGVLYQLSYIGHNLQTKLWSR
jgi:hypothetical protein